MHALVFSLALTRWSQSLDGIMAQHKLLRLMIPKAGLRRKVGFLSGQFSEVLLSSRLALTNSLGNHFEVVLEFFGKILGRFHERSWSLLDLAILDLVVKVVSDSLPLLVLL